MKIINFGSLNVDYVYDVEEIVRPGETIAATAMSAFPGGKGANQSVAMARAGAEVWHAGMVGKDTSWLRDVLSGEGVDVRHVAVSEVVAGGHAIIQVDKGGMNSIVVLGGTNQAMKETKIKEVLQDACPGDWLSLQNEINLTSPLLQAGKTAGMKVCFNPSPLTPQVREYPLECVDLFVVNELEASCIAGQEEGEPEVLAERIAALYPEAMLCITLGSKGALFYSRKEGFIHQAAFSVEAVDTTGAGDTFTGYLLAGMSGGLDIAVALERSARAAALSVTRKGAIPSIPRLAEL